MKRIASFLYTTWGVFAFNALVFIGVIVAYVTWPFGRRGLKWLLRFTRFIAKTWMRLTGMTLEIEGQENLDKNQNYVFTANHTSYADTVAVAASVKHVFLPLAMKEAVDLPIIGHIFKRACVLVDRSDKESRRKSVLAIKEKAKDDISVFIFPEGGLNVDAKKPLSHFYTGAFRIAITLQKPVLPLAIIGGRPMLTPEQKPPLTRCDLKCVFGKPIPTKGLTEEDAHLLREKTFRAIEAILIEKDPLFKGHEPATLEEINGGLPKRS